MTFDDSLRGYAHPIHIRDGFTCVYCGLDGTATLSNWLHLSQDHLLPVGHPNRDDPDFIVTACRFCNEAHNRTRFDVDGRSPAEIVESKRQAIRSRRGEYEAFWRERVASDGPTSPSRGSS